MSQRDEIFKQFTNKDPELIDPIKDGFELEKFIDAQKIIVENIIKNENLNSNMI